MQVYTQGGEQVAWELTSQAKKFEIEANNPFKDAYLFMKSEHHNAKGIVESLNSVDQLQKILWQKQQKYEKKRDGKETSPGLAIINKLKK